MESASEKRKNNKYKILPVLIRDLLTIANLELDNHLVLGKIVKINSSNEYYHKYILDDGTGLLNLNFFIKEHELKEISIIQDKIQQYYVIGLIDKKLCNALRTLTAMINVENVIDFDLQLGTKILIYGKLSSIESAQFTVYSIYRCDRQNNIDLEISFKKFLLKCYNKK